MLGVSRSRLIQELSWGNRIRELERKRQREQSTLRSTFSSARQLGHHISNRFAKQWESIVQFLKSYRKTTQMNGIDFDTTRVCGGSASQVIEMELPAHEGVSYEIGHLSIESQRTESERISHQDLDSVQEERDASSIV